MGKPDRHLHISGSKMAESCDSSDDGSKWYSDFKWSRSLSERVRGIRDSTLNRVWKKFREHKLAGKVLPYCLFVRRWESGITRIKGEESCEDTECNEGGRVRVLC